VGWELRGDSGADSEHPHKASRAGMVTVTTNSHIPRQIYRDKDGTRSVQEGESVGEDQQGARLGTDIPTA